MINDIGQEPAYESSDLKKALAIEGADMHAKQQERKAAFWQVYSAMNASVVYVDADQELIAQEALKAVSAGFKALEGDGDE